MKRTPHAFPIALRGLAACLLIATFALGSRNSAAGEITTTIDECHPPAPIPIPPYSGTIAFSNGHPGVTTEAKFGPGIENYTCTVVTVSDFNNNPDAQTGSTLQSTDLSFLIFGSDIVHLPSASSSPNPDSEITGQDASPVPAQTPTPEWGCDPVFGYIGSDGECHIVHLGNGSGAGGVRGSLDVLDGWVLTTASPAYLSFLTPSFSDTEYVPFIVGSSAPGDSLSIYGPGGVLWSQPLSDFTLDDLYFAQIPAQMGAYGAPLALTYYVHNDTETEHSEIWFPDVSFTPDTTAVPEPSTLSLLGLGFAALYFARRKRQCPSGARRPS